MVRRMNKDEILLAAIMEKMVEPDKTMKATCYTSDESEAVCKVRWNQYQERVREVNRAVWRLWQLQKQNQELSNMNNEINNLLK
jgi:hypothetical protein